MLNWFVSKRRKLVSVVLFLVTVMSQGSAGAETIERASKKDLIMLLDAASGMNSAYWATYIGESKGRVYIEYETAVHASSLFSKELKRVVYWLPRIEITEEQLKQLKAYKSKYEKKK